MARSAAKRKFESLVISKGVVRQVSAEYQIKGKKIGIVGLGSIGGALLSEFCAREIADTICVYDVRKNLARRIAKSKGVSFKISPKEILEDSDYVFGCTGRNWLRLYSIPTKLERPLKLVSCSSREVEFLSLLETEGGREISGFNDINIGRYPAISIANAGFPTNFDRVKEWEKPNEISITRCLVLASIIQATCVPPNYRASSSIGLIPEIQRLIVRNWKDEVDFNLDEIEGGVDIFREDFATTSWWQNLSLGDYDNISQLN